MFFNSDVQYTHSSQIATFFENFFSTFYYNFTIDYELDLITINAIILVTHQLLMYKKHVRNLFASLRAFTIIAWNDEPPNIACSATEYVQYARVWGLKRRDGFSIKGNSVTAYSTSK